MGDPSVTLPPSVENFIMKICTEKRIDPPESWARQKLATVDEGVAIKILSNIYNKQRRIRDLNSLIVWFINNPRSPVRASAQRSSVVNPQSPYRNQVQSSQSPVGYPHQSPSNSPFQKDQSLVRHPHPSTSDNQVQGLAVRSHQNPPYCEAQSRQSLIGHHHHQNPSYSSFQDAQNFNEHSHQNAAAACSSSGPSHCTQSNPSPCGRGSPSLCDLVHAAAASFPSDMSSLAKMVAMADRKKTGRAGTIKNATFAPPTPISKPDDFASKEKGKGKEKEGDATEDKSSASTLALCDGHQKRTRDDEVGEASQVADASKRRHSEEVVDVPDSTRQQDSSRSGHFAGSRSSGSRGDSIVEGRVRDSDKVPWKRSGFKYPKSPLEFRTLAKDVLQTTPTLEGLNVSSVQDAPFMGIIPDPDYLKTITGLSIEESANRGGAHFTQALSHYIHVCTEVASTVSSKAYALSMEERYNKSQARIAELEEKLKNKEEELEKKTKEVESAICSHNKATTEYEKQKTILAAKCSEVKALSTKVAAYEDVNREIKASEWATKAQVEELKKKVEDFESEEYTKKVVEVFKESEAYKDAVISESFVYLKRGSAHMVRQLHHFFKDKTPLIEAYELFFANREARGGANFVPFSDEELREIREMDAENKEDPWTPPTPTVPTFFDLVDGTLPTEMTNAEDVEQIAQTSLEVANTPVVGVPSNTFEATTLTIAPITRLSLAWTLTPTPGAETPTGLPNTSTPTSGAETPILLAPTPDP